MLFFRFLHYPSGAAAGDLIAAPHTDHSGFTFHLYETSDGCERLDYDGEWKPLPVESGETAAFAGMQTQLVTHGEVKALCHRVVANNESSVHGRLAIVCFIALSDTPMYNKQLNGRLQEFEPGFNYTMNDDKFSTLFIKS